MNSPDSASGSAPTPPEGSLEALIALQTSAQAEVQRLENSSQTLPSEPFQHLDHLLDPFTALAQESSINASLLGNVRDTIEALRKLTKERTGL